MVSVVLDSNLLLLLVVGIADRTYIKKHKRLQAYNEGDFDLLRQLIAPMSTIVVTPNILTEASNFAQQIAEPARARIATAFAALLDGLDEQYVSSTQAAAQPEFSRLWLTDSGILNRMTNEHVLLTADLSLYLAAERRGQKAINYTHLRDL
ncbi:MAG: hypothetical protein AB7H71_08875 [Alphaproteobacteria bacterium]